jgi:hypothetical protein
MSGLLGAAAGEEPPRYETRELIAADKVRNTPVFAADGAQQGVVEDVMIDKRSGHVAFVLVSAGGFLGIGSSLRPVPWAALSFDIGLGGYVLGVPAERLWDAPGYGGDAEALGGDYGRRLEAHYGLPDTA